MSTTVSPVEKAKSIEVRRVKVHSPSQLPADYGTTPGGTMFATTPGGTRIIYDRSFLLECRNSPLARSPLANLPMIPGVTCPRERNGSGGSSPGKTSTRPNNPPLSPLTKQSQDENLVVEAPRTDKNTKPSPDGDDPQFEMDM